MAYDQAVAKAEAAYEAVVSKAEKARKAAVREVARDYAIVLQHEIELATKAGKLDEALALRNEAERVAENLAGDTPPRSQRGLDGAWEVKQSNGCVRWYIFRGTAAIFSDASRERRQGRVRADGKHWLVDFGDGKLDAIRIVGDRIDVRTFKPASDYLKGTGLPGVGSRLAE